MREALEMVLSGFESGAAISIAVAMRRVFAELSSVRTASGKIERITLHWTAGSYHHVYDEYHGCIRGDGVRLATRPLTVKGASSGSLAAWGCKSSHTIRLIFHACSTR